MDDQAMDPLCDNAIKRSRRLIEPTWEELPPDSREERDAWASFLHVAPVLCKQARDILKRQPLYAWLVWYERERCCVPSLRVLNGKGLRFRAICPGPTGRVDDHYCLRFTPQSVPVVDTRFSADALPAACFQEV